ncbi:MAG TPA: arsenate reductase ArsC [Candidatus Dormibacteraeota bacterium]|nr:arsenate reductase ArsC [Candidatus Dormibacteraeota bacterium]
MSAAPQHRIRVLFICIHNSARSQMAEAFANALLGDRIHAESAGLEAGTLNPLAVEAMREIGIDISRSPTRRVFDLFTAGELFDIVVTVCDESSAERCPIFPGFTQRLHWSFSDPSALSGTHEERLAATRVIRDAIRARITAWGETLGA